MDLKAGPMLKAFSLKDLYGPNTLPREMQGLEWGLAFGSLTSFDTLAFEKKIFSVVTFSESRGVSTISCHGYCSHLCCIQDRPVRSLMIVIPVFFCSLVYSAKNILG